MQKVGIYLDDLRPCPQEGGIPFLLAKTVEEGMALLRAWKGSVHLLSLDHDLGEGEKEGRHLVRGMIEEGLWADHIYIHSANPIGIEYMWGYLTNAKEQGMLPSHVRIYRGPMPWYRLDGTYIEE